jgi:hypothetical protein
VRRPRRRGIGAGRSCWRTATGGDGVDRGAGGDGAAVGAVLNYFAGHQSRVNYAVRLRRGQPIGSGLVEGSIKQLLNVRLKQTGPAGGSNTWRRWSSWRPLRPDPSGRHSGSRTDRVQNQEEHPRHDIPLMLELTRGRPCTKMPQAITKCGA